MSKRTYDISQELPAVCNLLDIDMERILNRLGLQDCPRQPFSLIVSPRQVASIFACVITEYGKDDFHIKLANGFARAAFGHAFLAMQCSETLRDGVHRVARFKQLIEPVRWTVREDDQTLRVCLEQLTRDFPVNGVSEIMSFLWLVQCCRNITARSIVPVQVSITGPVMHQEQIGQDLGCAITIADVAFIDFSISMMETPILSCNHVVLNDLDARADSLLRDAVNDQNFVNVVEGMVKELLPSGDVTAERIARRLSLSKRSLERRLANNGRSFSELVRDCRLRLAEYYLRETHLSIKEISLMLGYREVNSFHRAYKIWHGVTPNALRNGAA